MNHSRSILRTSPICFGATKNFTVLLSSVSGVLRIRSTRSEEHTSELQSQSNLVCRLLLEKKNIYHIIFTVLPAFTTHGEKAKTIATAHQRPFTQVPGSSRIFNEDRRIHRTVLAC